MKLLLALLFATGLAQTNFSLPDDESQFSGPDADLLNGNCLACHGTEMVLLQPKMTAEQWGHSVAKMRSVYKAPITDEDAAKLPAALAQVQGAAVGRKPLLLMPSGLSLSKPSLSGQ